MLPRHEAHPVVVRHTPLSAINMNGNVGHSRYVLRIDINSAPVVKRTINEHPLQSSCMQCAQIKALTWSLPGP